MALHPEHTYLGGGVVDVDGGWPYVLVLEEVVDHDHTLWCLEPDGAVKWKITQFSDWVVGPAKLYRDTLVILTRDKLRALRPEDGAVLWSVSP